MALTTEEKKKIQARVKELESGGIGTQVAIKQAFDEVAGPNALAETIASKKTFAESETKEEITEEEEIEKATDYTPESVVKSNKPYVDPSLVDKNLDLRQNYEKVKQDYIKTRRDEFKALGYGEAVAESEAIKEFNFLFGQPVATGMGDYNERKRGLLGTSKATIPDIQSGDPGLLDALRPQTFFPGSSKEEEIGRFDPKVTAASTEVNWSAVKDLLKKDSKVSDKELDNYIDALKDAYQVLVQERRSQKATGGLDASAFTEDTFNKLMDQIQKIGTETFSDPEEAAAKSRLAEGDLGASDIFGRQIVPGKEVPLLTPAQLAFLSKLSEKDIEKTVQERIAKGEKKKVWTLKDGTEITNEEYVERQQNAVDRKSQDLALVGAKPSERDLTKDEIKEEEAQIKRASFKESFFLDPEVMAEYRRDPNAFFKKTEDGILFDETPFGGQKETGFGQALRIVLAPMNAFAGFVAPKAFEGFDLIDRLDPNSEPGETIGEKIKATKRANRPKLYKDSPVFYNIATNRGFLGEAQETADILGLDNEGFPIRALYLGGNFAADILDPTFEILKAATVGTKTTIAAKSASKALESLNKVSGGKLPTGLADGLKAASNDLLDTVLFGTLEKRLPGFRFKVSDPRTLASSNLARSLEASGETSKKIAAAPDSSVSAIADDLSRSERYKGSAYEQAWQREKAKNANRPASEFLEEVNRAEPLIAKTDDILKGVDEIKKTGSSLLVRSKEIARQLGALASTDPAVAAAFKQIDEAGVTEKSKISQYLNALNEDQFQRFKKGMIYDFSLKKIYDVTRGDKYIGNLVAATKNVLVDRNILPKIMEAAKESPIGKLANELRSSKISFETIGNNIAQVYRLSPEQVKAATDRINQLITFRKVDNATAEILLRNLEAGFIPTKELRSLIDAEVDMIAESLASGKAGLEAPALVERSRDVSRLPMQRQLDRLVPLEARSFTRAWLKDFTSKITGKFTDQGSKLSVGQKQLLREAMQKAGAMDVKLRTIMKDLVGFKPPIMKDLVGVKPQEEVRALYGISPGESLTNRQALAYAILGPTAARTDPFASFDSVMEFALNALFPNEKTKENIFDLFSGTEIARDTSSFTPEGYRRYIKNDLDEGRLSLVDEAIDRIVADPKTLWQEIESIASKISDDLANPELRSKYFKGNVKDIIKTNGEIPPEVSLGMYYKSEAEAINKEVLFDLVNKEIGRGAVDPLASFDEAYQGYISKLFRENNIESLPDVYINLVNNRLKKGLETSDFKIIPMSAEDVADVFLGPSRLKSQAQREADELIRAVEKETAEAFDKLNIRANLDRRPGMPPVIDRKKLEAITKRAEAKIKKIKEQAQSVDPRSERGKRLLEVGRPNDIVRAQELLNNEKFSEVISNLTESANDVASTIIRSNNLKSASSFSEVEKTIDKMFQGNEAATLKGMFGEDVAEQIKTNMTEGFSSLKNDLLNKVSTKYNDDFWTQAGYFLNTLIDIINNFRYTMLLNVRPRFHGVNLSTGADIVYQTTGKLPNYLDVGQGLRLSYLSQASPNKIILQSGTKDYTAREVYNLLFQQGGRSIDRASLPSLSSGRALSVISDEKFSVIERAYGKFAAAPQAEDMAYRYAVFADAIRSGRSESEAVELARRSMYDASDITSVEKSIQNMTLFYGWQRNNFVNFVKNLASSEGRLRIARSLRTGEAIQDLMTSEEDQRWMPGYFQTKLLLSKIPGTNKDLYFTTPSQPARDALNLMSELLKGNFSDIATNMLNPNYKLLFDIENPMDAYRNKVIPEHVYLAKVASDASGVPVQDVLSQLVGSEIVPRQGLPEEGAINGYVYPLTTPQQQRAYNYVTGTLQFLGLETALRDWIKTLSGGEGTAVQKLSPAEQVAYFFASGAGYSIPAWKQDYYNKLAKMSAITSAKSTLEKFETMPTEGERAPTPIIPPVDRDLAAKARATERIGVDRMEKFKDVDTLLAEVDKLYDAYMTGKTNYPRTPEGKALYLEESGINAKRAEIRRLLNQNKSQAKPDRPAGKRPPPPPPPAGKRPPPPPPPAGKRPPPPPPPKRR